MSCLTMAFTVLNILELILVEFLILYASAHQISVDSKAGRDNETCLANFSQPCRTLGFVLERLESFTTVEIHSGFYSLDKSYNITSKQNISLIGKSRELVQIKCNQSKAECGLWFQFCEEIHFDNLTFDGCGQSQETSPIENGSSAGISFTFCTNLQINHCTFKNSRRFAMALFDTGGIVDVIRSHFLNTSGGGFLLYLNQSGSNPMFNNYNSYTFKHSVFEENYYGPGITALICGSAQRNSLRIDSCNFTSNQAMFGGGIFVEFHNEAQGNSVVFKNNTFVKNTATYGGGAIRTGNNIIEKGKKALEENGIRYVDNRFYQNTATLGGAVSHYGWTYHQQSPNDNRKISLENCHFMKNMATMGSAIAVALNDKNRWMEMGNEMPYALELTNCTIEDNIADRAEEKVIGMGTVYTTKVPCILKGTNTFYNNSNTALLLDNAPLKVYGEALFIKNMGYKGGAMGIYGQARLIMTKDSHLVFKYNEARERGGALYFSEPGPDIAPIDTTELRRHECFIVYEDSGTMINIDKIQNGKWHARIDFINNSAPLFYGNSVYATTLQSCYLANEQSRRNTALEWKRVISYTGNIEEEIATDPVAIEFNPKEWSSLAPFEKFNASIWLLDEKNSTVSGTVKIKICGINEQLKTSTERMPSLVPELSLFLVQPFKSGNKTISSVSGLRVRGIVGQIFTVEIVTICSGQTVSAISDEMKLRNCFGGFEQNERAAKTEGNCVCMNDTETLHEGVSRCSDDGRSVYLKTGYWGGYSGNQRDFITYPCPLDRCKFDNTKFDFLYNKSTMCNHDRSADSVLCGKCKEGFSLTVLGEQCIEDAKCSSSELVGSIFTVIVVSFILVVIILFLDVDIFTSYLNCWLYFYQVLPFVVQDPKKLDFVMKGILALASWRIPGISYPCLKKGFDSSKAVLFNFSVPVLMLFWLGLRWCCINSTWCQECINKYCQCCFKMHVNTLKAMSTILVLCFTHLTFLSFSVWRWVRIDDDFWFFLIPGSVPNIPWYFYLCLGLSVVFIICFDIILPLYLMFYFHFERLKNDIDDNAVKTSLLEIFQRSFRDGYKWFSAFYFLCRVALLTLNVAPVLSTPGPRKRLLIESFVVVSLVVFAFCKPYKDTQKMEDEDDTAQQVADEGRLKRVVAKLEESPINCWCLRKDDQVRQNFGMLNIADTLILFILCIITLLSSACNSEASDETRKNVKIAMIVFSWFPMAYFLGLILQPMLLSCWRLKECCSKVDLKGKRREYEHLPETTRV